MAKRQFTRLKADRRREILESEIENLEVQQWARERDRAKWTKINPEGMRAVELDDRLLQQIQQERSQNLAKCEYDLELLEIAIQNAEEELSSLGPKGQASKGAVS